MKKILVTGSAGFIGCNLIDSLFNDQYELYGIDNLSSYYDKSLKLARNRFNLNKYIFHELDLSDEKSLRNLFQSTKFDIVIHLAAQPGVRYSFEDPYSYIKNNIECSYNLFNVIKDFNIDHLLIASTSSVYGSQIKTTAFKETLNSNFPISLYASTKKSMEIIAHNYSHNYNIPTTIFRFFTVYGPWGRPDMALFKFIKSILSEEKIEIYGNGKMFRDFTFIDDLTLSIKKLIDCAPHESDRYINDCLSKVAPYRIVNIGNQKAVNLNDFVSCLEKTLGKKAKKEYLPIQPGDVPFTLSDSSLLFDLTKYKPDTPIKNGINKFYQWYKQYYNLKK